MHSLAGVGHAQREQVHGDQITRQEDHDLAEIDLGLSALGVGLGDEFSLIARPCSTRIPGLRAATEARTTG